VSYALTAAIAEHPPTRARVRACLVELAATIAEEPTDGPAVDVADGGQAVDASYNRAARIALARAVLADPGSALEPFAWIVAAAPQVLAAAYGTEVGALALDEGPGRADDAALAQIVAAAWDRVARRRGLTA
jgi:hypothetical protein